MMSRFLPMRDGYCPISRSWSARRTLANVGTKPRNDATLSDKEVVILAACGVIVPSVRANSKHRSKAAKSSAPEDQMLLGSQHDFDRSKYMELMEKVKTNLDERATVGFFIWILLCCVSVR